ncbi:MAG: YbjQ family protein [Dehalococcoidia bacterium]
MIVVTTEQIASKRTTETLGLVRGSTIRARHMGRDIVAGLRTIVGGEIKEYTVMLAQAREEALQRMVEEAERIGADAVVGTRFVTSMVMSGAAEIVAYGTAVKVA